MENFWNRLTTPKRKALLNSAGYINYGSSYAYRVWSAIPASIRTDVQYTAQRMGLQ